MDFMKEKRTHYCGDVNEALIGQTVTVMGWVNKRRDLGQLIFIALRDRTGVVQVVANENDANGEIFEKASSVRGEFVVSATGVVIARTDKNINPNMKTGKIEIELTDLRILSGANVPPFQVADTGVNEDLRLRYRYIDLRRPEMQEKMFTRHRALQIIRNYFTEEGFIEVDTPILTKSTPEGARDYLVPSRVNQGSFYALPQSPQLFKQLCMISGFDRYFQIAKCFRDEDLRADRQPEFTHVDTELSFVDMEDIFEINERLMKKLFKELLNVDIQTPFARMPYNEAMERYGVDKPDVRYGMELTNISDIVKGSEFGMFEDAINNNGSVRAINVVGGNKAFSRKKIDALVDFAKTYKAKGLAWINISETGEVKSTIGKFFDENKTNEIISKMDAKNGDLILICADKDEVVFDALGNLRCEVAKQLELYDKNDFKFLWVTDFPLLEYNEEENRYVAKHHPFTMPKDEDIHLLDTDPSKVRAKAYDMVLNGTEIAGGSLRIYQNDLQHKMFKALGFSEEEVLERFGFFVEALTYGVPPHGGMAYGLDRLLMYIVGADSIRDVIAFPKTKDGGCPLTSAPSVVDDKQLEDLGIRVVVKDKE